MGEAIQRSQVDELILVACPSYAPVRAAANDLNVDEESGERLCYLDAGDLTRHLVALQAEGRTETFPAVFEVIERLHVEGDAYVRELATIGYLEGLQFAASHEPRVDESDFVDYLGPESLRWWRGLVAFWAGSAERVEPLDT